ncbi:MAG: hypothetical protein ACRDRO_01890 [Pseudonocardiaceae bacterium]
MERVPYDRIIATAAVCRIPYPRAAQTRPGGRILLPWANSYTGALVALTQWRYWPFDEHTGVGVFWLLDFESRSWAKLIHTSPDAGDDEFRVHKSGPRRLWDEVHAAHRWWVDQGKPDVDRWRFTVTSQGQQIGLS